MKTELAFSVIYKAEETNDINDFDFFVRMVPKETSNCIDVSVIPRFSLDGKLVKHLKFSIISEWNLSAYDVLSALGKLKVLKVIVQDTSMTTPEAENRLKELILQGLLPSKKD